ncbi:hypothetical protein ABE137_12585 [Brevibacillus laterosporus]
MSKNNLEDKLRKKFESKNSPHAILMGTGTVDNDKKPDDKKKQSKEKVAPKIEGKKEQEPLKKEPEQQKNDEPQPSQQENKKEPEGKKGESKQITSEKTDSKKAPDNDDSSNKTKQTEQEEKTEQRSSRGGGRRKKKEESKLKSFKRKDKSFTENHIQQSFYVNTDIWDAMEEILVWGEKTNFINEALRKLLLGDEDCVAYLELENKELLTRLKKLPTPYDSRAL